MEEINLKPMDIAEILAKLDEALSQLLINELDNLERGIKEPNISGYLTIYLKPLFDNYNVDPEYNGDIDKPNDRKALSIAKNRIDAIRKQINEGNNYKITPDIIVHKRKTNDFNLLVIEVKKDSSPKYEKEFDLIKLEHLTIDYSGNHYNYDLGVAIVFGTGDDAGKYKITYFQEGLPKERQDLG